MRTFLAFTLSALSLSAYALQDATGPGQAPVGFVKEVRRAVNLGGDLEPRWNDDKHPHKSPAHRHHHGKSHHHHAPAPKHHHPKPTKSKPTKKPSKPTKKPTKKPAKPIKKPTKPTKKPTTPTKKPTKPTTKPTAKPTTCVVPPSSSANPSPPAPSSSGVTPAPPPPSPYVTCPVNANSDAVPARCLAADPPYLEPEQVLYDNIVCPTTEGGVSGVRAPYLLVPGTGNNGAQSWQEGYVQLLGKTDIGLGYDVCYLFEEDMMLKDAQITAARIAYAINTLSTIARNHTIVQGWSQGNLDIQWTETFWTSSRTNTRQFISLAGDFKGTTQPPADIRPAPASVVQQDDDSNFLRALARNGGLIAKVPTTTIFSNTDEIITPEVGINPISTSYLSSSATAGVGYGNIQAYCPLTPEAHGQQLYFLPTYTIVLAALRSPLRYATTEMIAEAIDCRPIPVPLLNDAQVANLTSAIVVAGAAIITPSEFFVLEEPEVMPYARGSV